MFANKAKFLLPAALCGLLLSACSDSSGPPPQPVVTPVDSATAGSIAIRVRYAGEVPEPVEINMRASGKCAELHDEPVYDRPVQVDDGRLANAVVYIKSGLGDRAFQHPTEPLVIDQRGCLYHPRVSAMMVGQPLEFLNSDPEAHNVRGRPEKVSSWNFMMSRPKSTRTVYFDKSEIGIRVGCDVHPWMSAYVSVLPNPYFGVTGKNGEVQLTNVPPGEYVVATWHETLGEREVTVKLEPRGKQSATIDY